MVDFILVVKLQIVNGKEYALGIQRSDFDSEEKFQSALKALLEAARRAVTDAQNKKSEDIIL